MNIEEEFLKFIEFPEGSDGMYVYTVSAKLFAKHCAGHLEQECDQLKLIISAIDSKIPLTPNTFGGIYMTALEQQDIDQLRQKAQE